MVVDATPPPSVSPAAPYVAALPTSLSSVSSVISGTIGAVLSPLQAARTTQTPASNAARERCKADIERTLKGDLCIISIGRMLRQPAVGLVTYAKVPDLTDDDRPLIEDFARLKCRATPAVWDDASVD